MVRLMHLHEPGVLHNLGARYTNDTIYTNTSSILIAVNPFKPMPHLFSSDVLDKYRDTLSMTSPRAAEAAGSLPPHVYAVACAAYKQMLRDGAGQAILVRVMVSHWTEIASMHGMSNVCFLCAS